jgi:mono/diheme cytochrome c family protein
MRLGSVVLAFTVIGYLVLCAAIYGEPPTATKKKTELLAPDKMKWQKGEALYRQNCASCHGADLKGRCMAPSLVGVTRRMADDRIVAHARKIGETMCCARHIRNLTDDQFADIVAYFHALDTNPAAKRGAEEAGQGAGCCCCSRGH